MRRQLNVKLLLWLIATLLVCGMGTHLLHAYQVKRNAGVFLREADKAQEEGDRDLALTYLSRYLAYEPGDTKALAKYGLALNANPRTYLQSILIMEEVVRRDPTQSEVRLRLAKCQMAQGAQRLPDAIEHLHVLLADWPKKGEIEHLLGSCHEASGAHVKAAIWLRKAIAADPRQVDSYVLLADILQTKLDQPEEAGQVMDALVTANATSFRVYLLRARFHKQHGAQAEAEKDMDRAVELAPGNHEVLAAAAEWAQAKGDFDKSRKTLQRALDLSPRDESLYLKLAILDVRGKHPDQAIAGLRRGLEVLPQARDLRIFLADLLIDQGNRTEAQTNIALLRPTHSALAGYLQARLAVADKQWLSALSLLQQAQKELEPASPWQAKVHALLGWCHEQLGDTEQQRRAFERAVALDPAWPEVRVGLGAALLNTGRVDEALIEFRFVEELADPPAHLWPLLARALIVRNLRMPVAKRDWIPVEDVLRKLAKLQPDSVELALLRSEMLFGQNKFDQAEDLLQKARVKQPQQTSLWIAQAELAGQQKQWQTAVELLDEAQRRLGDRLELRLALCRIWVARGGKEAPAALTALGQNRNAFTAEQDVCLLRALAEGWQQLGSLDQAADLWQQIAHRLPDDSWSRFRLFELALQTHNEAKAREVYTELVRREGDNGLWSRFARATLLFHDSRGRDRAKLDEAERLLDELAPERRDWPELPLLQAKIAEAKGNTEQAVDRYLAAMDRGKVSPRLVEHMIRLLVGRGRLLEAEQILRKLEDQGPLNDPDLVRLAAEVALANRDPARALRLAGAVVNLATRDYRDLLWLARTAQAAGAPAQAEDAVRRAVKVAGHAPDTWVALVQHLVRTNQRAAADEVLVQAQARLPADRVVLVLARCQEMLGRLDRAEAHFLQALKARPYDAGILSRVAEFYCRQDQPEKAEPFLRTLLDPAAEAPGERLHWARRKLALILAARGTPAATEEAMELLDRNVRDLGKNIADDRARALVLGGKKEDRGEAVNLFEATLHKQPLTAVEQFGLAQLYEAAGDSAKASDLLLDLLAREDSPQVLAFFIRTLLNRDQATDAGTYLARLERLEPGSARTRQLQEAVRKAQAQ